MGVYKKQRKDGSTAWYFDFMYDGIRYRGVGGTTKTQALRAMEKRRTDVLNGEFCIDIPVNNPRIEIFAITYLERRRHLRSQKRDDLSVRTLLGFFKGFKLQSISPSDIEDYIGKRLATGKTNGTINRELACLKRMFNLAIKWSAARKNPVNNVDFLEEPPGRTRFLSIDEARRLIDCAADHLKSILITALNTGMRRMEILTLKWDQVHIDKVIQPYIEIKVTKNNKKRFVELNDDMVTLLKGMNQNFSEYVFLSKRGKPLKSVRKPFLMASKKAGIEDFRFHDLRHTFASHYLMNGGDLMSLKDLLGHSSMRMVMRYAHLTGSYKREMVNNLNGKFNNCHLFATSPEKSQSG